jgi:Fic family protein
MTIIERVDRCHVALGKIRPFEGHLLKQLRDYYRIGFTWSSNALEGNTLTITETKVVLEDGLTIGGRPLRDFYETIGHGRAYDYIFTLLRERRVSATDILIIHRLFYKEIDEENAGVWRKQSVVVSGTDYAFPHPSTLAEHMAELDDWIARERTTLHPVTFAALLHLKFVTIHPFIDGNGRVGRLLMNLALIQDGYQLAIIPPLLRLEYIDAIRRYQRNSESQPFCEFIAERVYETQKDVMRMLHIALPEQT